MSSGFSGRYPDFYNFGGVNGRSVMNLNNSQGPYRPSLPGITSDQASLLQRRSNLIGKRSLADFQQQFQHQQQQQLGLYLRNVKHRVNYQQHASPISRLSPPVDFSGNSISPEFSAISSNLSPSAMYGLPVLQQLRGPSGVPIISDVGVNTEEKKMMSRLQELEKELLNDNEDDQNGVASVLTNSEWSETIQNLIGSGHNNYISPSPTSSASSCSSSSVSPPICAKQSLIEAASAISDGKNDVGLDTLTRLIKVGNTRGTSEERLVTYLAHALVDRVNSTQCTTELYSNQHLESVQMLYEMSPCFKLGFISANLAILEEIVSDSNNIKLHVIDFDIGQGRQYLHLLHTLAAKMKNENKMISLKITAFVDQNVPSSGLISVKDGLNAVANRVGVNFTFNAMDSNLFNLTRDAIGVGNDEVLVVNLAFKLFKLPDESVTTENLRDALLRSVKALSPKVVTVVEQDMNCNTALFLPRVTEVLKYYGALFDSLDSTLSRDNVDRLRIEEGLSRKMCNSVACDGRDRVERCEVFGKWRARMGMAGFEAKKLSQKLVDALRVKVNSGTRGNPGFTVREELIGGGVGFGWMGRTLTVASAWR
ncbi:scarecrow-like protein 8 [Heracleum sosnowskyi]|uniref:Scarecrow-like protein 8 n=1 Tax=Heracleum sosnowskyi TaxID=360622 RepID=A0AAD8N2T2_9APIA|nr:scarecrow-like protein 8 [Heracleum sosnowskyi]